MASSSATAPMPEIGKHKWTLEEDTMLVEEMVNLFHVGTHRADCGFKPGHLAVLEKELVRRMPWVKGEPHIKSRIKTLKKDLYVLLELQSKSGFGWDSEKKCVTADNEVWAELIKANKRMAPYKHKHFPLFEDLHMIFGHDRATGEHAESAADMVEDIVMEEARQEDGTQRLRRSRSPFGEWQDSPSRSPSAGPPKRRRRITPGSDGDELGSVIIDRVDRLSDKLSDASSAMRDAIEDPLRRCRGDLKEELARLDNIDIEDRYVLLDHIGMQDRRVEMFFSLSLPEKELYCKGLLKHIV